MTRTSGRVLPVVSGGNHVLGARVTLRPTFKENNGDINLSMEGGLWIGHKAIKVKTCHLKFFNKRPVCNGAGRAFKRAA